ncbi:uncharacterized protein TNCV_1013961 [Trichonephila clavipes]|uniref:Uncharacterized protein n=1 Tax=Trichonephila clavipes TaxID=2585209 RepID=A0A8X7BB83_TRICX|nr:uncharacterized protein TNCV_1013961 [Trichonephila clavipes]
MYEGESNERDPTPAQEWFGPSSAMLACSTETSLTYESNAKVRSKTRPRSSRNPSPDTIVQVDELIRQERRTIELAERMNISHDSVHSIIQDHLGYRLLCAEWILKLLNGHQKTESFGAALNHLIPYHNEGDDFLLEIVTGDESWCHHYEPETRRQNLQ